MESRGRPDAEGTEREPEEGIGEGERERENACRQEETQKT